MLKTEKSISRIAISTEPPWGYLPELDVKIEFPAWSTDRDKMVFLACFDMVPNYEEFRNSHWRDWPTSGDNFPPAIAGAGMSHFSEIDEWMARYDVARAKAWIKEVYDTLNQ